MFGRVPLWGAISSEEINLRQYMEQMREQHGRLRAEAACRGQVERAPGEGDEAATDLGDSEMARRLDYIESRMLEQQ